MSEQTLKILRMLEEGKITANEASDLLSKVEALEQEATRPSAGPEAEPRRAGPRPFTMPDPGQVTIPPIHIPDVPIPDINRIVNDAIREAFGGAFPPGRHAPHPPRGEGARADLGGAHFAGAKLEHTDLTDARLNEKTKLQGADLRFASFVDADLRGADLRGANLSYSDFTDADLENADLQGSQLHHGTYTDANFSGANLKGADLSLSDLTDASFENVNHPGLALRGMKMVGIRYEPAGEAQSPDQTGAYAPQDVEEAGAGTETDLMEAEDVSYGGEVDTGQESVETGASWT